MESKFGKNLRILLSDIFNLCNKWFVQLSKEFESTYCLKRMPKFYQYKCFSNLIPFVNSNCVQFIRTELIVRVALFNFKLIREEQSIFIVTQ